MTGPRWTLLRMIFLLAVAAGAWWSWRDSGDELVVALGQVGMGQLVLAAALVVVGLLLTGWVWWIAFGSFGVRDAAAREMVPQFFVAQLGKYIPGSVWLFAAQGALGARHGVPPRVSASATVLFLGMHVATGLVLAGGLAAWTSLPATTVALSPLLALVGLAGLVPAVYRAIGRRMSGQACEWGPRRSLLCAAVMVPVWCCYALALVVVVPDPSVSLVLTLGCAFALAHAAGVAVPIAPAGLGARDGVLLVLIAPLLGTGTAGMVAVVARLLHAVADLLLAAAAWCFTRTSVGRRRSRSPGADH